MQHLIDTVGAWAPLIVFLLAAAECSLFIGFVFPGEIAVILGGVAAGTGRTPLAATMAAAVAGAVIGDSIGYWIGTLAGPAVLRWKRLDRYRVRLEMARDGIGRRGWWALVVGRFTAVLRAIVPFAAGLVGMSYRHFLLGNAIGGVLWGVGFTLAGFLAGANYPRVERLLRTGGLIAAGAVIVLGVGFLVIRRQVKARRLRRTGDRGAAGDGASQSLL